MTTAEITLEHIDAGCRAAIAARDGHPTDGHGYDQSSWCGTACCIWGHAVLAAGLPLDEADDGPPDDWPHRDIAKALGCPDTTPEQVLSRARVGGKIDETGAIVGNGWVLSGGRAVVRNRGHAVVWDGGQAVVWNGGQAVVWDDGRADVRYGGYVGVRNGGRADVWNRGYADVWNGGQSVVWNGGRANVRDGGYADVWDGGYAFVWDRGRAFVRNRGHAFVRNGGHADGPGIIYRE